MQEGQMNEIGLPEAAQRLGISWHRAWRLMLEGRLRGEKRHGRWVVTERSLSIFLARRQGEPNEASDS